MLDLNESGSNALEPTELHSEDGAEDYHCASLPRDLHQNEYLRIYLLCVSKP